MMFKLTLFLAALILPVFGVSTEQGVAEINEAVNLLQAAPANYSTIIQLLQNANYAEALNLTDGTSKTLFAPSNDAFTALAATVDLESILLNETLVITILEYHVIPQYLPAATVVSILSSTNPASVPTLEESPVNVSLVNGSTILVNTAAVIDADIDASGTTAVHGIDGVLVPPSVLAALETLAPAPALEPSPGPSSEAPEPAPSPSPGTSESRNGTREVQLVVNGLLNATGNYSILLSLLGNSTFTSTLNLTDGNDKTVFAPTNEAFAALPANVTTLLANATIVQQVLSYHIVPAYLPAATVLSVLANADNSTVIPTLLGQNLTVTLTQNNLKVQDSDVIETDIVASNITAVHGIDAVLVPSLDSETVPSPSPSIPPPPPPPRSASVSTSSASTRGGILLSAVFCGALAALVLVL